MDKIKSIFLKCRDKCRDWINQFKELSAVKKSTARIKHIYTYRVVQLFSVALLIEIIVEILSRRSVGDGLKFVFTSPIISGYSILIIMCSLSLAYFFKKRTFVYTLISSFWLLLATVNCVVLGFRTTPLAMTDFELITSVYTIASAYLTTANVITIIVGVLALIAAFVLIWLKTGKVERKFNRSLVASVILFTFTFSLTAVLLNFGIITNKFANLPAAYKNYGFVYCFTSGALDRGISKPSGYSPESVSEVVGGDDDEESGEESKYPNIIFLQLESFFDVNYLNNMTFTENPIPNFTKLKEEYPTGFFTVPAIGAGTANTEFEVITQMSLEYFGTGEYPYKTILQQRTCESICYNLKELGYSTFAIHNHSGAFYDRNDVFAQLGFDVFSALEYMQDVTYTPRGWARDYVLQDEIMSALDSTDNQDLIYCISVQPHGRYPTSLTKYPDLEIGVISDIDEDLANQFTYYVNQLHETDDFLGQLLAELEDYPEDTIVVMYGDHIPSLTINQEDLDVGNLYQTEYVIWSNFDFDVEPEDLHSYQIASFVFENLGITEGTLTKYHQKNRDLDEEQYKYGLELLEYDMLYGDMEVYGGVNPFEATDLKMGIHDIKINSVDYVGDSLCITGNNFTSFSNVQINGKLYDTVFINKYTLLVTDVKVMDEFEVEVVQIGKNKEPLSYTETYKYTAPEYDEGDPDALEEDMIDDNELNME